MHQKISIIVITYNAKEDLKECLESLEKQNYNEKEIVIVNDASTDGTLKFLRNYKSQSGVETLIISNNKNLGVAGARNVGIQHASGDIIAFTDADCVASKNWASELVKGYDQNGVIAVGGKICAKRITNIWEMSEKGHEFIASKEGYVSYIVGCNMSFKSSVLKKFLFNDEIKYGYEEKLLCDYLINEGYKIYYNPKAVVEHKHRNTLLGLLKRKYQLGVSSVWYRKKQNKLFMFKRHIILLMALFLIPFVIISKLFLYIFCTLFIVFISSLLRDEINFKAKSIKEIIITYPFLIVIEFFHFYGSIVGLFKFKLFKKTIRD